MDTSIIIHSDDVIQHFGVKGMKWGVRRMYNNHVENLRYKYRKKGYSEEVVDNKLKKRKDCSSGWCYSKSKTYSQTRT